MAYSILVTGGAGYIGSHTLVELMAAGHRPVVFDNLSNGSLEALRRVRRIAGADIPFFRGDIRDPRALARCFANRRQAGDPIEAVLHLAGCKAVGESVADPIKYFDNNVSGTVTLLTSMRDFGVRQIVFSSSATVYGVPAFLPMTEKHPLGVTNPYGRSKLIVEQMLQDVCASDSGFSAVCLRYFNPIGSHPSGLIGEDPNDTPNNLFPFITQVAAGRQAFLRVFGQDYSTPDGTGVRDYLHVVDLARGHVAALAYAGEHAGCTAINLGTGQGTGVIELLRTFEQVTGRSVAWRGEGRRPGDVEQSYADPSLAHRLLNWRATHSLAQMCADGWRWQSANPAGYAGAPDSVPHKVASGAMAQFRTPLTTT